jgi:hypothetical protein
MNTGDEDQLTAEEEAELDRLGVAFTPAQYAELEGELRLRGLCDRLAG